ncbi:MAG: transporter, family, hexuronate transporter [Acidobacteriota bacterium]|jgi:ACS family hexuronate transporter-like MFS transporter
MATVANSRALERKPISNLRWWIGGLLFASTVINYIDRQTLSVLGPYLKNQYQWNNQQFAMIVIAFRVAYSIGQTVAGRLIDRIGTRKGLTITVIGYSIAAMLTSLAVGLRSFAFFRFLLGAGESANWPAATKAVSEWFPKKERGWAVALFDSGSSIGGAIAPLLVIGLYKYFGSWRPAFVITGTLGFLWLGVWRVVYHPPESHPRISDAERAMILRDRLDVQEADSHPQESRWRDLIKLPQTWAVIAARTMTDPVWFFITDWFAIYLVTKGINPEQALLAFWIPFVAADLGNFFGGGVSSWLINRGWPVIKARKAVVVFGGLGMTLLIPTVFTSNLLALAGLFAVSTFAYASFSTMALVLPSDLYRTQSVATASGMSGTGAGLGTILSTYLIGYVSDNYSFEPILITASLIPLLGMILVLTLVRSLNVTGQRSV